jgi:hypothetical protein
VTDMPHQPGTAPRQSQDKEFVNDGDGEARDGCLQRLAMKQGDAKQRETEDEKFDRDSKHIHASR